MNAFGSLIDKFVREIKSVTESDCRNSQHLNSCKIDVHQELDLLLKLLDFLIQAYDDAQDFNTFIHTFYLKLYKFIPS